MAPKSKVKRKCSTAYSKSSVIRKQRRVSVESVESVSTGPETLPRGDDLPDFEELLPTTDATTEEATDVTTEETGDATTEGATDVSTEGATNVTTEETTDATTEGATNAAVEGATDVTVEGTTDVTAERTTDAATSPSTPKTSNEVLDGFTESWLETLDKDDIKSLAIFLCHHCVSIFYFTETKASEYSASLVKKSARTVRRWRDGLIQNDGILPESQQGRYQRSGVLWKDEELNKTAVEFVRHNAAVKGRPNLTSLDFCKWVNDCLLPNSTLEPGFPRKIGIETARMWLHHLGFEILTVQKGIFIDGHERPDVIDSRKHFLCKLTKIGFLHFTNAPTDEAMRALPDVDAPTNEIRERTVVFFHDESTFMSNEDQPTQWGFKGEKMLKPKSKGSGIMVSDFIDEHNGFLALNDEEYDKIKASKPNLPKYAREFLEYGENREGYWTRDRFIAQMHRSIEIAEIKYPKEEGWRHAWVFDHSSCHAAMADDALDVNKMNMKPGGKQRIMHDTVWNGKEWKMYFNSRDGQKVAKGMKMVLEERGVSTEGKSADWMRQTLSQHSDFKEEKSMIENMLIRRGHIPCFLPKFHPELNPIERVWAQLKRFTKSHCKYSLPSLRKNIPSAYESVSLENIRNHFRKVRHYMFCYLEGLTPGKELDEALQKYKIAVKSHRRVGINE